MGILAVIALCVKVNQICLSMTAQGFNHGKNVIGIGAIHEAGEGVIEGNVAFYFIRVLLSKLAEDKTGHGICQAGAADVDYPDVIAHEFGMNKQLF